MSASKTEEQAAREDVQAYAEAVEHFETHDLGDELEEMPPAQFDVHVSPRRTLYPLNAELSERLRDIARQRGVTAEGLLNLWVQEKVAQVSHHGDEKAAEILTVGAAE